MLVSDNGIRGAVISLKNSLKQIEVVDNILTQNVVLCLVKLLNMQ